MQEDIIQQLLHKVLQNKINAKSNNHGDKTDKIRLLDQHRI